MRTEQRNAKFHLELRSPGFPEPYRSASVVIRIWSIWRTGIHGLCENLFSFSSIIILMLTLNPRLLLWVFHLSFERENWEIPSIQRARMLALPSDGYYFIFFLKLLSVFFTIDWLIDSWYLLIPKFSGIWDDSMGKVCSGKFIDCSEGETLYTLW